MLRLRPLGQTWRYVSQYGPLSSKFLYLQTRAPHIPFAYSHGKPMMIFPEASVVMYCHSRECSFDSISSPTRWGCSAPGCLNIIGHLNEKQALRETFKHLFRGFTVCEARRRRPGEA